MLKEIFKLIKKDNRNREDIYKNAISKIGDVNFNPIVGLNRYGEEINEDIALKNAIPINVKIKEISFYD